MDTENGGSANYKYSKQQQCNNRLKKLGKCNFLHSNKYTL